MLRWTGLLAWLSLALVVHNLVLGPAQWVTPKLAVLLLVGASIGLEWTSLALPGFGLFSSAPAPLIALALLPGGSLATLALLLNLALLFLRFPSKEQLLAHAFPILAAVAAIEQTQRLFPASTALHQALPCLVGPSVLLALQHSRWLTPFLRGSEKLAYTRVQREVRGLNLACALASLPLAWAAPASPAACLLLLPLLYSLNRAAQNEVFRVNSTMAYEARQVLKSSQAALLEVHREKDRTQAELLATEKERRSLDALTQLLTQEVNLNSLGQLIFDTLGQSIQARSFVIFQGGIPVFSRSPLQARLEGAALTGLVEPLVSQAQALSRPVTQIESGETNRLMSGESCAVAVPLGTGHALYVGREQPEWSPAELRWIVWVCARASAALGSIEQQLRQKLELHQQSSARAALQAQVNWLEGLLELSRRLAGSVDPENIRLNTQITVEGLVPHQGGLLCDQDLEVRGRWGHLPLPWLHCLIAAARVVVEFGKPLLIPQVEQSKFALPEGPAGLLCVPLIDEGGISGALLLAAAQPVIFDRSHQDLLLLIAGQCAVALSKARLFVALRDSQAQVVQTSKLMAVGQLAAGVAHELNTPLGAISLMLEGAAGQLHKAPDNAARKLERAQSALLRAKGIVEKLLVYSRKSEPELAPLQPAEVVREAVDFVEPQLRQQGVKVRREMGPPNGETVLVLGKSQDLQQILINLMLNAAQAVQDQPDDRREVEVGCRVQGQEVHIYVEDRGEGIAPEVLSRIFEPFFTTRPVGRGTGLGLSISQQIAHQHGGRIEVNSALGEGSRFSLGLPIFLAGGSGMTTWLPSIVPE